MANTEIAVELKGITKRFPGIVANDSISFQLRKGEIHALLGENGAGKSTLMNILFGLYQPDEGHIEMYGEPVVIQNARQAIQLGIGMVHQHFKLVQPFTVTENIILGKETVKGIRLNRAEAVKRVGELSKRYGLAVEPEARVEDISVGMQQRVEILKALYRGAEILIFDEPTAVLTPQEIVELLAVMKRLAAEGKSIILITHKLKEIMQVADRVTVIRRGKVVDSLDVNETNPDDLAERMVGRNVRFDIHKEPTTPGNPVLELRDVICKNQEGRAVLDGINLSVRAGEIVGIAGVDGNGQTELAEIIAGLRKIASGTVMLDGRNMTNSRPREMTRAGLGHVPEDRHKHGLVLDFSMAENLVLQSYNQRPFARRGFLKREAINRHAEKLIDAFDVRTPSIHTAARALSGGNQQKGIIARETEREPKLLIAAQPTRGLDIGAIEFVHTQLVESRNRGNAVLLVSFELDEILRLSDRIAVIYEGRIVGELLPQHTNDRELGLMMAGSLVKEGGSA